MNILSNAIDALEESGIRSQASEKQATISIRTEKTQDNWITIRITDNGMGIPENVRAKLFDPFFTTKPIGKGTGLGLSISYQIIVERHGGKPDLAKAFCQVRIGGQMQVTEQQMPWFQAVDLLSHRFLDLDQELRPVVQRVGIR